MHSGHNKSHIRLTKFPTNTPLGVGTDSSCPYPYIVKSVFSHYQIRVFVSSQTDVHILKYVYSNHHTRISVPHFVGVYVYAGAINRPLRLVTVCQQRCWRIGIIWQTLRKISTFNHEMRATNLQQHNIQKTKTILLQCKNPLFARQKPYFCIAKTMLLFCEYVTYTE